MTVLQGTSRNRRFVAPAAALLLALLAHTAPVLADVHALQDTWAEIMYQGAKDQREAALEKLAEQARQEVASHPDDPELLIWRGIIVSTFAGEHGGLGALSLAKEARASLEQALAISPTALEGSAYTSLGSLYYKVPGWPVGFGSDKQAREYLEKALEINPQGIDPNYFMGEFLIEAGQKAQGRKYLETALAAPDRTGRTLADQGRRAEIRALLGGLDDGR